MTRRRPDRTTTPPHVPAPRAAPDRPVPADLVGAAAVDALRAAGWEIVRTDEARAAADRMEQRVAEADARLRAAADRLAAAAAAATAAAARAVPDGAALLTAEIDELVGQQVLASRAEVHRLYEPMVELARNVSRDSGSAPDARGLAIRLVDLIGSRS
jgi:hypothetical protein